MRLFARPGRKTAIAAALASAALFALGAAWAGEPEGDASAGCAQHKWPLAHEAALLSKLAAPALSGFDAEWSADKADAFAVALEPSGEAPFIIPPERKAGGDTYSGVVRLSGVKAGVYQITLSDAAWIDVVQDGRFASTQGFSGAPGCPARKSVRFVLKDGEATLQLSGAGVKEIGVIVSALPASD